MPQFIRPLVLFVCVTAIVARVTAADRSPETTIREFYTWYLHALVANTEPLAQEDKMKQFVTSRLLKDIERASTVDSDMDGGGLDHDPIICAQDFDKDWAKNMRVTGIKADRDQAMAMLEFRDREFARHKLKLRLVREEDDWKIDKIVDAD